MPFLRIGVKSANQSTSRALAHDVVANFTSWPILSSTFFVTPTSLHFECVDRQSSHYNAL